MEGEKTQPLGPDWRIRSATKKPQLPANPVPVLPGMVSLPWGEKEEMARVQGTKGHGA